MSHIDTQYPIGKIPAELDQLGHLTHLYLGCNKLCGVIPAMNNMTALVRVHLQNNALTGSIPEVGHLPDLTHLLLSGNELSGAIPECLWSAFPQVQVKIHGNSGLSLPGWWALEDS